MNWISDRLPLASGTYRARLLSSVSYDNELIMFAYFDAVLNRWGKISVTENGAALQMLSAHDLTVTQEKVWLEND